MHNYISIYDDLITEGYCQKLIDKFETNPQCHSKKHLDQDEWSRNFTQINFYQNPIFHEDAAHLGRIFQEAIEHYKKDNQITIGMNTREASLAGGAYFYRVIADETVWNKDTNPLLIIRAQISKPDNSQIWMTFQNTTQYPQKGLQTFQVEFQRGKVINIKNITKDTSC